jgi:hypothetical protein
LSSLFSSPPPPPPPPPPPRDTDATMQKKQAALAPLNDPAAPGLRSKSPVHTGLRSAPVHTPDSGDVRSSLAERRAVQEGLGPGFPLATPPPPPLEGTVDETPRRPMECSEEDGNEDSGTMSCNSDEAAQPSARPQKKAQAMRRRAIEKSRRRGSRSRQQLALRLRRAKEAAENSGSEASLSQGSGGTNAEANDLFDDIQRNPLPEDPVDATVEAILPPALPRESRAKFYLTAAELQAGYVDISRRSSTLFDDGQNHFRDGDGLDTLDIDVTFRLRSILYFQAARTELRSAGYAILEGILQDTAAGTSLSELLEFFVNRYSGPGCPRKATDPWKPIVNTSATGRRESSGRFTVPRIQYCDELETDHRPYALRKLYVEAILGHIMDKLGLTGQDRSDLAARKLFFPKTGSRLLMTVEGCKRQLPHLDYAELPPTTEPCAIRGDESYFVMASGADPFVLVIWPYTHAMMNCSGSTAREISAKWPSRIVKIPPYSVIVARGDLVHAGAASEDDEERHSGSREYKYKYNVRMHLYAMREGTKLLDAVHLPSNYLFE